MMKFSVIDTQAKKKVIVARPLKKGRMVAKKYNIKKSRGLYRQFMDGKYSIIIHDCQQRSLEEKF